MWLPALGLFLFLTAGIWWATSPSDPPSDATAAAPAGSAAPADAGSR